MGDLNQKLYLKKHLSAVDGPILEIGSKDYGTTANFREDFVGNEYTGVDLAEGQNVDIVQDLVDGIGELKKDRYALGICCSVLEHVNKPWIMADHVSSLIRPGGKLFISVPWVFKYHPYPDDYYRFSWRGIAELFPKFEWDHILYSTNIEGEFFPVDLKITCKENELGAIIKETDNGDRHYLPKLMVNMLGTKL